MTLTVGEFAAAACHYPIVFAAGETLPLAVLGWREGENCFCDGDGRWRGGVYMPACARRPGAPWHADGAPACSEALNERLAETRHFGLWLDANRMLDARTISAELSDGTRSVLRGFKLINPARVLALTDTQVLELHRRGWLNLLHLHLQSLENWRRLNGPVRIDYLPAGG